MTTMKRLDDLIKDLTQANKRLNEMVSLEPTRIHKDATIQRFEFTFELAWKTIQAYIRDQGFDCKSPKNCFRRGAEIEIISDPEAWINYLDMRNLIAHTYNKKMADKIYSQALKFPQEVNNLLKEIS